MSAVSLADPSAGTYDADDVAALGKMSKRHVRRLADAGLMPPPMHIGRLVRWQKKSIDEWFAAGCPSSRSTKGSGKADRGGTGARLLVACGDLGSDVTT